jgi:hypothetical protein
MAADRVVGSDELSTLRATVGEAQVMEEGGYTYVHLPFLTFLSGNEEVTSEAVIVPQQVPSLGGYTTRLLLKQPTRTPVNWAVVTVLGQSWHTWSWNSVPSSMPLIEILGNHLKALR